MALRFSILTPTLDRCSMLRDAMASVRVQNWPEVEHIVADGGSSDGTQDMLAAEPDVRIIRGPDRGIYDGLNKALAVVQGDVVGWLNSDDVYLPGAFAAAAAVFAASPGIAAVCGGVEIESGGKIERVYPAELVADLSPAAVLIGPTLPNAWFFRRAAIVETGAFADEFRCAADGDFMLRFARLHLQVAAASAQFYRYRRHPASATLRDDHASETVCLDMLRLAHKWRDDADPEVRSVARALEGRCRTMLLLHALRGGRFNIAARHALQASLLARGIFDYAARRIVPRLRRRRLGVRVGQAARGRIS